MPNFGAGEDRFSLVDVVGALRDSFGAILGIGVVFLLAAVVYAFVAEPVFTAVAQVMLEPSKARSVLDEQNRAEPTVDQARIESHIEILRSDQLALDVIRKLQLSSIFEFGAPEGERDKERYAALAFANHLSARRIGQSMVIEVAFRFRDPVLAASITNALVESYIARETKLKLDAIERANQWLYERQATLQNQAKNALDELERFKQENWSGSPQTAARLSDLENQAQSFQRMHDAFLQKFNETIQKVSLPDPDARIISPASVPLRRSHPKRGLIIAFGTVIGVGVAIAFVLIRRALDQTIRTAVQLQGRVDCWGAVSHLPRAEVNGRKVEDRLTREQRQRPSLAVFMDPVLNAVAQRPSSGMAAEFRNIKVALDCGTDGQKPRVIGVAAVRGQEGATTVAANLAALYALYGAQTLLVDSCPHNPTATRELYQNGDTELAHCASERSAVKDPSQDGRQRLRVLRAAHMTVCSNITDCIGSRQPACDIAALREEYDVVIFDLPALGRSPDARAIVRFLDAVILVAEAGSTPLPLVLAAVDTLRAARAAIVGVVLNKVRRA